jgi:hypothetical protein
MLAGLAGGGDGGAFDIAGGARFIFGAYPDEPKLLELKRQGVTAVISLQHPGVIIEREGIMAERESAKKLHMSLIQAPMLPWVSNNEGSLEKLRVIARTGRGVFYVHCGLGRDRVNVAKRVIEAEGNKVALSSDIKAATEFTDRAETFERGSLANFDRGKWLIPYPNEHEMFGFILGGQAGQVISLLDPLDPEQGAWNREMERLMKEYSIPFTMRPLPANASPASAIQIAREVRAIPGPVAVIVEQTPNENGKPRSHTQAAFAFLKAYAAVAPSSPAAKPSWQLNKAGSAGQRQGAATVAR